MIEVVDLHFNYSDDRIIQGVDLKIPDGQFTAFLGANGSGKSTLVKHFNALLRPSAGKVLIDGMDTSEYENTIPIRQRVGMVFQNPDNQIVATVVEDDVAFALENLGVEPSEIRSRVDEALRAVGLYDFREREPHLLSGGQKQRLAIASIVAMGPEILIFDEPTAMLDPMGRLDVSRLVRSLRAQGKTIIYVTHNVDEIVEADRVVVMDSGKVVLDDTPQRLFADTALCSRLGVEIPAVPRMCNELVRLGFRNFRGKMTLEELVEETCRFKSGK